MPKVDPAVEAAIRKAAEEEGIDPAEAMAYAERESTFNPAARASSSMKGLYQMSAANRRAYGDAEDAYGQTKAWIRHRAANHAEMASVLGRDPTASEAYIGHHVGGVRAARMMGMDPETPVNQVFTSRELAENPHFGKAGTTGNLTSSLISDMDTRQAKYGGDTALDFSPQVGGAPAQPPATMAQAKGGGLLDFSSQVQGQ